MLETQFCDYIRVADIDPLTTRQLNLLDKYCDSRLARHLLRACGPAPDAFVRAINRQWLAYDSDTFGTQAFEPTMPYLRRQTRNTRREQRTTARRLKRLKQYRHPPLAVFLDWKLAMPRAPLLVITAVQNQELPDPLVREFHWAVIFTLRFC